MSRQGWTTALLLLTAAVGLTLTIAMPGCRNQTGSSKPESKVPESGAGGETTVIAEQPAAGRKTQVPPREIAVELGDGVKLEMVLIPAGEFLMGSPDSDKWARDDEKPQHQVRITKPFYLGKYLVTQEQWEAVMGGNPSHFRGPKNPVESVTWEACQQFCEKLNVRVHRPRPSSLPEGEDEFRLPTEAQWEYACRAGSRTRYCFGDDESGLGEYAWHDASQTHPVGEKKPNAWGLYDMHGNVWEWCWDWCDGGYYARSPTDDPTGPAGGSYHLSRGGGWIYPAEFCRSACRYGPGIREYTLGFRVALVPASGGQVNVP